MTAPAELVAWLEAANGEQLPLAGNLSFGRVAGNEVVLADERVSRQHAAIHAQGDSEFWLVDLGSRNGTYLNDRRVGQPARLHDRDQLRIGPYTYRFHQPGSGPAASAVAHTTQQTLVEMRSAVCWLLVADIEGATRAAQAGSPDEVAKLLGQWFRRCHKLVEGAGGTVNKYLGDGFLAFWKADTTPVSKLAGVVTELRTWQGAGDPSFRFVLHHGQVLFGGGGSLGEESLSGPTVNFVFRMEKLAAVLGERCLFSEAAFDRMKTVIAGETLGEHALSGFAGRHAFFKPQS